MSLKASADCLKLIKYYEHFMPAPYRCPAREITIGFGHRILPGEKFPIPFTEPDALALLRKDVAGFERDVLSLVKVPLAQYQFDALISFCFNVGSDIDADTIAEGLGDSTLLKKLNRGDYQGAAQEFSKWVYAKSQKLNGLVKRRESERRLFLGEGLHLN